MVSVVELVLANGQRVDLQAGDQITIGEVGGVVYQRPQIAPIFVDF